MSVGSVIDGEPNIAAQALAIKRALVQVIADAPYKSIDDATMALLQVPVDLNHMYKFGGGTTAHAPTRGTLATARVGNFVAAQYESHLADIDARLKALGGS